MLGLVWRALGPQQPVQKRQESVEATPTRRYDEGFRPELVGERLAACWPLKAVLALFQVQTAVHLISAGRVQVVPAGPAE